jgi:hypothetical protein
MYEIVRPVGKVTVKATPPAPRLDTLNGKTICEVYNDMFRGDRTFPKIRELLKKRYQDVNIIPYSEFPSLEVAGIIEDKLKDLSTGLAQKNCDVLIAGNGG